MGDEQSGPLTRVARDARGARTTFEEIEVGEDLGTMEWAVTRERIQLLCRSDDDYHEWYSVESPYGGVIAPVLMSYPPARMLFSRRHNVRGLFYEIQSENVNPIRPGKRMVLSGKVADKWIKKDREYVAYAVSCIDEDGFEVFRTRRSHVLDYIPRTAPRTAEGFDSGVVAPDIDKLVEQVSQRSAASSAKQPCTAAAGVLPFQGDRLGIVSQDTPKGWRLPAVSRQMSLQQFVNRHRALYGEHAWPEQNLHADARAAQQEGLPAPVAAAPTVFALVTRMLMTTFAEGWIQGGRFAVKMIKPVYAENFVTAKGQIVDKIEEEGSTRFACDVWVENEQRQKVVVGTASALLRERHAG